MKRPAPRTWSRRSPLPTVDPADTVGPCGFFDEPGTELFTDQYARTHVRFLVGDHFEVHPLRSRATRRAMTRWYAEHQGQRVSRRAVQEELEFADAFADTTRTLANRSAWDDHQGGLWVDLVDRDWAAVHVTVDGWKVISDPPPLFRRFTHQRPLPEPDGGGDLNELRDLLPQLQEEADWLLIATWLVTAWVPIPHPVLALVGTQGAAKSTATAFLRRLIDPSQVELLGQDARADLPLTVFNHAVPAFDNVDKLTAPQADLLCQVVTGRGIARRQLYTDNDEMILAVRRPVLLNGLHLPTSRADFLDRCLPVYLDRIPADRRIGLRRVEDAFRDAHPRLVGGLLTLLSRALRLLPEVSEERLGRMADFHHWGRAVATALEESPERFDEAYHAAEQRQKRGVVANTYLQAVLLFARMVREWKGTPTDLFRRLGEVAQDHRLRRSPEFWPESPEAQGRGLPQLAETLADHGVSIVHRRGRERRVEVRYDPEQDALGQGE